MMSTLLEHPILDHLWQSTLLALGLGLLTLAFGKARAGVRHGLWFAASMKFLVPFAALAALGRFLASKGLAPTLPEPALIEKAAGSLSRFPFDRSPIPLSPIAQVPLSPSSLTVDVVHAAPHLDLTLIVLAIWAIGCLAVLARWMVRWTQIRNIVRLATPLPWPAPMPVLASPLLLEPGLIGFVRPVLVVPETLPDHLGQSEIDAIVAHEASHLRRRDNLTAAAHMLVEVLFWFHPLVWWIGARLIEERERACDEAVVRAGHDRAAYARGLVESCRLYLQSPLSCVAGASGSDLKTRVALIMTAPLSSPLSPSRKALLAAVGAGAVLAPFAAGLLSAPPRALIGAARIVALATGAPLAHLHDRNPIALLSGPAIARGPVVPRMGAKGRTQGLLTLVDIPTLPTPESVATASTPAAEVPEVAQAQAVPIPSAEVQSPGAEAEPLLTPVSNTVATVTVRAAPPPKTIRQQSRNFVRSLTVAANPELGQIARWRDAICVRVAGLTDAQDAQIKARIEDVASSLDIHVSKAGCRPNVHVLFTDKPQALMDEVAKRHEFMLGYYHRHDRDRLKTVTRPIQAWYVTATENEDPFTSRIGPTFVGGRNPYGRGVIDDPDQGSPPGCDDAPRMRSCRWSLISNVFVVADSKALQGRDAGLIADYLVMVTLAQPKSLDGCSSLPSMMDLFAKSACPERDAPTGLTQGDAAYLTALYKADLETRKNFAEADISDRMAQLLIKAWAPFSRQ